MRAILIALSRHRRHGSSNVTRRAAGRHVRSMEGRVRPLRFPGIASLLPYLMATGAGCMEIAIIGAGNVGAALATAWKRAGHAILLGLRDVGKNSELIKTTGARALSPVDAAQKAEVVVLALPYEAVEPAVADLGPLAGKVLI